LKSRKASRASTVAALLVALLALALPACGSANDQDRSTGGEATASAKRGVGLKKIGSFDAPVYVTGAPGFPKLLFVVEQEGRIAVIDGGRRAGTFLDLRDLVNYGGERGLLSVAFPPDYARSKRFYVYYTDAAGAIQIDEFQRRSATRAAAGSRRPVVTIPHPDNSNHNGGQLQFLDNLLYFGTGDGGSGGDPPNNAQNKDVLLGKLLRIDPRAAGGRPYSVPASNPLVGRPGRDEIFSYGLRNPFRFSFDTTPRTAPDRDRRRRPERVRGARLRNRRQGQRRQFRLGRPRGLQQVHRREQRHPRSRRHGQADSRLPPQPRQQLLDHRRLCRPRSSACRPARPLCLCRPLRGSAPLAGSPFETGERRPQARSPGLEPQLVRRRRAAPALRRLARRSRLPPRPALKRGRIYILRATRCIFLSTLAFMVVMTPREGWTDERLDDLKAHMDEGFREVRAELRQIRGEMGGMARQTDMDARFDQLHRSMQIGFSLIAAVLVALIGLIATQL
jgi:hypothetical protein